MYVVRNGCDVTDRPPASDKQRSMKITRNAVFLTGFYWSKHMEYGVSFLLYQV